MERTIREERLFWKYRKEKNLSWASSLKGAGMGSTVEGWWAQMKVQVDPEFWLREAKRICGQLSRGQNRRPSWGQVGQGQRSKAAVANGQSSRVDKGHGGLVGTIECQGESGSRRRCHCLSHPLPFSCWLSPCVRNSPLRKMPPLSFWGYYYQVCFGVRVINASCSNDLAQDFNDLTSYMFISCSLSQWLSLSAGSVIQWDPNKVPFTRG